MNYRKMGRTGWDVSVIGFGAWGIGGGWGAKDDAEATRALERYLDLGGNFIDTAYGYGDGHSERLIGEVLKRRSHPSGRIYVATKIPPRNSKWPQKPGTPIGEAFPARWVKLCAETSLKRLGLETVDLLQLHIWLDEWNDQLEWYEAMTQLRDEGKVRAFGVSIADYDPASGVRLAESGRVDAIQVIYNLFEQKPEETLFPAARANGVGILVRVPFEEGALTGRFRPGHSFEPDDWRKDLFTPDRLEQLQPQLAALEDHLDSDAPDLPALALRFCLHHPAVSTVLPGMRKVKNVEANMRVDSGVSKEKVAALRSAAWDHGWRYPWVNTW